MPTYIGNTSSSNITTGSTITSGSFTFTAAASKIIPGATSISLRNNADSADNLIITNAGAATIRAGLTITTGGLVVTAGGVTVTATGITITAGGLTLTDDNITFNGTSKKIIQPVTSLLIRDHADANTNVTITDAGAMTVRTTLTATGGIVAAGGYTALPYLVHTGGMKATLSTDGTDATPSTTETYVAQIFVPCNMSVTGISIFNGSATGSGNVTGYLMSSDGAAQIATTASTAISGTDAYQRIAWTGGPIAVKGPATYFLATQYNNTASRFNTHLFGDFPAGKITSTVYGTFASFTVPTTFTASLGPYASLY